MQAGSLFLHLRGSPLGFDMNAIWHGMALTALVVVVAGCSKSDKNYDVLESKKISCSDGALPQYEPWGKSGTQLVCSLKHGSVTIAENGHVVIEGQYEMGKQVGEWRWFDESGKVVRTEHYSIVKE